MALRFPIYMDCHATTPVDPRVVEAMLPYFHERFGNPASARLHALGRQAEEAVEAARGEVAALLGAAPREILFTSGATEALNLAIRGAMEARRDRGDHAVVAAAEHKVVLAVADRLAREGKRVTVLPVDGFGRIDPTALAEAIGPRTVLVAAMWANNEIGTVNPVAEIGALCRARDVLFICDASQAAGRVVVDVAAAGADLLAVSAHKMYGPKGSGALFVRSGVALAPILDGGGHERGLCPGTLNVPGIVGFGAACRIAAAEMGPEAERLRFLSGRLRDLVCGGLDRVCMNGHPQTRLPGNVNLSIENAEADSLLGRIPEIAASTGAACASIDREPSHVLTAIGLPRRLAECSIRFGLGRESSLEEVEYVAGRVVEEALFLRRSSPYGAHGRADAR